MNPEEVERLVGRISEKDVMDFAKRKLWDQDIAISAVGSIEGLLDYNRVRNISKSFLAGFLFFWSLPVADSMILCRSEETCLA